MERVIVDKNTGEIIGEMATGDKILKKKSYQFLRNNLKVNYNNFLLLNQESLIKMNEFLTGNEFRYFFMLLAYVQYAGRPLGSARKPMAMKELAKDLEISNSTLYRNLTSLEEKGLVKKIDNEIYINPYIAVKGTRVDKEILEMFKDTIWRDDYPAL